VAHQLVAVLASDAPRDQVASLRHSGTLTWHRTRTARFWSFVVEAEDSSVSELEESALDGTLQAEAAAATQASTRGEQRRGKLETVALWTQVVGLPLAILAVIFAGLSYEHQANETQRAVAAVQVEQHELSEQQKALKALLEQLQASKS
jgi:hypothetical protein